jgi:type VI secretion system protein ImpI
MDAPLASAGVGKASDADFIRRFAEGAGLDPRMIEVGDAGELAERLGMLMHLCAGNLAQLLIARARAKTAMRSANQTQIQLQGNNPLRFAPTPQDAMAIMFGRPTPSYLEATEAFEQAFLTLQKEQKDTYEAIRESLQLFLEEFEPAALEQSVEAPKGALFGGERAHKARLWEQFSARWKARSEAFDGGMYGAFMRLFVEAYDRRQEAVTRPPV